MKKPRIVVFTAIAGLLATTVVVAQRPSPDQMAVGFRQAVMTVMAGTAGPLGQMTRGRMPYDAAAVSKASGRLTVLAGFVPDAFARDTSAAAGVKTEALPLIWMNHAEFLMRANDLQMRADELATAVKDGNEDAIKTAMKNVGTTCGACHDKFRKSDK